MKDVIIQFQNYFKCTKLKGTFSKWGVMTKLYSYSSKNGRREEVYTSTHVTMFIENDSCHVVRKNECLIQNLVVVGCHNN